MKRVSAGLRARRDDGLLRERQRSHGFSSRLWSIRSACATCSGRSLTSRGQRLITSKATATRTPPRRGCTTRSSSVAALNVWANQKEPPAGRLQKEQVQSEGAWAARQRPRPDAENFGGEVSVRTSLSGLSSRSPRRRRPASPAARTGHSVGYFAFSYG